MISVLQNTCKICVKYIYALYLYTRQIFRSCHMRYYCTVKSSENKNSYLIVKKKFIIIYLTTIIHKFLFRFYSAFILLSKG